MAAGGMMRFFANRTTFKVYLSEQMQVRSLITAVHASSRAHLSLLDHHHAAEHSIFYHYTVI